MWSSARSEARSRPELPVRSKSARSARQTPAASLDEASGTLKLHLPAAHQPRAAIGWALDQRHGSTARFARRFPPSRSRMARASLSKASRRRSPGRRGIAYPAAGRWRAALRRPEAGLARRVEAFLKRRAIATMSTRCGVRLAAGVAASAVSVGMPGRAGAAVSSQADPLSWRLILAPPNVRRYVVAHEVAHLRHLDHGADFKAARARLSGPRGRGESGATCRWAAAPPDRPRI